MSRSWGETPFTTSPPMAIAPEVGSSSPAIIRRAVVFPQPDGPTRTMNSPSAMVQVSASTALVPFGKTFATSWNETSATIRTSCVSGRDSRQHDRTSQVLRMIGIKSLSLSEFDGHPLDENELGHRICPPVDDGGPSARRVGEHARIDRSDGPHEGPAAGRADRAVAVFHRRVRLGPGGGRFAQLEGRLIRDAYGPALPQEHELPELRGLYWQRPSERCLPVHNRGFEPVTDVRAQQGERRGREARLNN